MTVAILDVRTGHFEPAGTLLTSRSMHSAVLLKDGRVLLAGGLGDSRDEWPRTIEVYDPDTRSSRVVGELKHHGAHLPAICLDDGTVLLAGIGFGTEFAARIDPETGSVVYVGHAEAGPGAELSATMLSDGKVLITGSLCGCKGEPWGLVFDPADNRLTPRGQMAHRRFGHRSTSLADGTVLISGGHEVSECEIYDPASGKFTPAGALASPRTDHQAVLLDTGEVLVFGGLAGGKGTRESAEVFDPKTRTWRPAEPPQGFYLQGHAVLLPSGEVLAANDVGEIERFDPTTGHWHGRRRWLF